MPSLHDGFGALRLPAPAVSSAIDLDTGHESILGLLEAAINSELGDAWRQIVANLPADHYLVRAPAAINPVRHTSSLEMTPQQMAQFKAEWPVLAVYREGEPEFFWLTTQYRGLKQKWSVDWVVGPIHAAHTNKIGRFAVSVGRVIVAAITHGYHPDFRSGVRQFAGEFAEIECIGIQGPGRQVSLGEESGSGYYGITITLETTERMFQDGYTDSTTWDVNAGYLGATDGVETPMTEHWMTVDDEGLIAVPIPPVVP